MKKKAQKKRPQPERDNPMVVDEAEFTDVIRKMVNTEPTPLKKLRRRRNPYEGPLIPPQKT